MKRPLIYLLAALFFVAGINSLSSQNKPVTPKKPTGIVNPGTPKPKVAGSIKPVNAIKTDPQNITQPKPLNMEYTIVLQEGNRKIPRQAVIRVNVLFINNLCASFVIYPSRVTGTVIASQALRFFMQATDTVISKIEVFAMCDYGCPDQAWDLKDVEVRHMAGKGTEYSYGESKNFFNGPVEMVRGKIVVSPEKQPARSPDLSKLFASSLFCEVAIGNDDIRAEYKTLDAWVKLKDLSVRWVRPLALNLEQKRKLKNYRVYTTERASSRDVGANTKISNFERDLFKKTFGDISQIGIVYEYGDHGPFDNDDWDLTGISFGVRGPVENTSYRFYANWNINRKMNRNSEWSANTGF
jgi:hypothetical protein